MQSVACLQRQWLVWICALLTPLLRGQSGATFGDVIPLGETPSDLVLDESRQRLYLVNSPANRVDVYDYSVKGIIGWFDVGTTPLSAALSMDNKFLYVTNHDSSSLSVISLTPIGNQILGSVVNTVSLPAKPEGVAVGFDGRVLISTDGSTTTGTSGTLLLFDGSQASLNQVLPVAFAPPMTTPAALQALPNTRPTTLFNGRLLPTPDGAFIVGVSEINTNISTVVFVYDCTAQSVVVSRTAIGQSSTLSMSPDGSAFMAGFTLYDRQTLNVIAQQSAANAPFTASALSLNLNKGGSVFSADGTTLYSAFNTTNLATPPPAPTATTLFISDPRNLAIRLGINLPESLIDKMVTTSTGSDAWGLSTSGLIHLPLATLFSYPILMPDSTTVFLAQDDCNRAVAQAALRINNIGGGTLKLALPATIPAAGTALIVSTDAGTAPATLTFTLDPGRSPVIRTPGTNLYTGAGSTNQGTVINLQLSSPNAINAVPIIRVFMNYRDSTMRGVIYPVATVPNSTTAAYEGLQDVLLDPVRNRVYISNSGYNRIEVFDTQKMAFQQPIPVGQLPHQMALGADGATLYVATTGGEQITLVNLDQQQVIGRIQIPPIPRNSNNALTAVRGMAVGQTSLQFVRSDGTLWSANNGMAAPRTGTSVTGINTSGAQTAISAPQAMLDSGDGSYGILLGGNGTAYLYNGAVDAYTSSHQLFTAPIIGYYGPLAAASGGSFLLANGLVLNPSLTAIGGAASPGQLVIVPPAGPFQFPGIGVTSTGLRNIAAVAPVDQRYFVRMSTAVRTTIASATSDDVHTLVEAVDTMTGATATAVLMPDNPVWSEFGITRTPMPPRQMVVDASGTIYAITLSGLSVVPLTLAGPPSQPQIGAGSLINAVDGTANVQPGSFVYVNGLNLAAGAIAQSFPLPTVLGGSCVLVGDVAVPLIATSGNQILAQLPASALSGLAVLQVRSLATAQQSPRVVVTIQQP